VSRRRSLLVLLAVAAALVLLAILGYGTRSVLESGGHLVSAVHTPNHDSDFDFSNPPCEPPPRPDPEPGDLLLRYLGGGGFWIEFDGHAVMTAPFFSNPPLTDVVAGDAEWNHEAIAAGLADLPLETLSVVLVGHSHYDHLADLPPILLEHAPATRAWVNRSGALMLAPFETLGERLTVIEELPQEWIRLRAADGSGLPFRILAVETGHADHLGPLHLASGEVEEPWQSWQDGPIREMREGRTFAFLIDLLDADDRTVFRILHTDAASEIPASSSPLWRTADRAVDVAVLCMPSYWEVEGYPEQLLARTRAGHAVVTHYENFLRPRGAPLRFLPLLTDRRADEFLRRVSDEMSTGAHIASGPLPCTCGPCSPAWSMPLPGEWLRFGAILPAP